MGLQEVLDGEDGFCEGGGDVGGWGGGDGAVGEVGVCFCVGGAPEVFREFLVGAGRGEGGGEEDVVWFWEAGCG